MPSRASSDRWNRARLSNAELSGCRSLVIRSSCGCAPAVVFTSTAATPKTKSWPLQGSDPRLNRCEVRQRAKKQAMQEEELTKETPLALWGKTVARLTKE